MSHFSIAGLQLTITNISNLEHIKSSVFDAKRRYPWLDMVVLPELSAHGVSTLNAEPLPGITEEFYCKLAKDTGLWLVAGSLFERYDGKIYNTCPVINPQGHVVERHRKIYPFYPYEKGVSGGDRFVVVDAPQGKIGVAICYDLWFPEIARALTVKGAECLIYPTLTGTIDRSLELTLARATAIQNQSYVFSVNCCAPLGNGRSAVFGPEGDEIYIAGGGEEIIPIEIDFQRVRRSRERGLLGLGQPLKSFRDGEVEYPQYQSSSLKQLNTLGDLAMPSKNDQVNKLDL